jgi:hypothetical protein
MKLQHLTHITIGHPGLILCQYSNAGARSHE